MEDGRTEGSYSMLLFGKVSPGKIATETGDIENVVNLTTPGSLLVLYYSTVHKKK